MSVVCDKKYAQNVHNLKQNPFGHHL